MTSKPRATLQADRARALADNTTGAITEAVMRGVIGDVADSAVFPADIAPDLARLAGIEDAATADMTGAEIKAAYEAEADTNAFTDAEKTKLAGVAPGAEVNPTGAEMAAALDAYLATPRWKAVEVPAGGTIGQVLKKQSGSDYDVAWADDATGGGGIGDGDRGDITVSGGGSVWTVDPAVLAPLAPLASPALTGTPSAPTAALGTNTTQIATAAFVQAAIAALVASSPAALDTLNELAAALGNDANFAATMTTALAGKAAANHSHFRGDWAPASGSFPGGGTALAGEIWRCSAGGTVNSITFVVGDMVMALVNNASTSTYSGNWIHIDITMPITSVAGLTGVISAANLTAALNVFTTALRGLVPASGGGTTNYLRADGTWAAPAGGGSVTVGSGVPSAAPASVGLLYVDTNGYDLYFSTGTATVSDWRKVIDNTDGGSISAKATPILADTVFQFDSAAGDAPVISTWTQIIAALKLVTLDANGRLVNPKATYTSFDGGTVSTGTYTPTSVDGNVQHYTNNGAHTLAPPANPGSFLIEIANGATAGAITTSGFTKVSGDAFTTTNGHKFQCSITRTNSTSHLNIKAMQ
jgi:hypothetical protein